MPYTWQGLHAWFQVTTSSTWSSTATSSKTLVIAGPTSCCTTPSNGFLYGGLATFDGLSPGDHYGFRLSGSNGDFNNFLQGTFTLSTKPYVDATLGTDNRDWPGAAPLPEGSPSVGGATGTLDEPGEARWFRFPVVPGQHVSVTLDNLPADYDIALYGDVGAAFEQLTGGTDVTSLAAGASAGAPGSGSQTPEYSVGGHRHPDQRDSPPRPLRASGLRASGLRAAGLRPPGLRPAGVCAAGVRASGLRARLLRARPGLQRRLPASLLRRPEPDPARGLGEHRAGQRDRLGLDRQHQRVLLRPRPGAQRPGLQQDRLLPPEPHHDQHSRLRRPAGLPGRPLDARGDARHQDRHRHRHQPAAPHGGQRGLHRLPVLLEQAEPGHRRRRGRPCRKHPDQFAVAAGGGPSVVPLRRQPRRRRHQGDRRPVPQRQQPLRRAGRRRRRDPVLPLPGRLGSRSGEPVLAAGPGGLTVGREPGPGPGTEPGRLRLRQDRHHRRRHPAPARPRRGPAGEEPRRDRGHHRQLPRPHRRDAPRADVHLDHRLRLPRRCRQAVNQQFTDAVNGRGRDPRQPDRPARHAPGPAVDGHRPRQRPARQPPRPRVPRGPLQRQRHARGRLPDHLRRRRSTRSTPTGPRVRTPTS